MEDNGGQFFKEMQPSDSAPDFSLSSLLGKTRTLLLFTSVAFLLLLVLIWTDFVTKAQYAT